MPRDAAPKASKSQQSARFIKTARELGTNDDPVAFDALFGRLVPPVMPKATESAPLKDAADYTKAHGSEPIDAPPPSRTPRLS